MEWTQISCYPTASDFTWSSREDVDVFKWQYIGTEVAVPWNPVDYSPKPPPQRGSMKSTIGGNSVKQYFGQFSNDREISFTHMLTLAEFDDFISAWALKGYTWKLEDFLGKDYVVTFDLKEGIVLSHKELNNDMYIVKFKFLVESVL